MKDNDTKLADMLTIGLMALVLFAAVGTLLGSWKKDIQQLLRLLREIKMTGLKVSINSYLEILDLT